jgi:hypothetical protein
MSMVKRVVLGIALLLALLMPPLSGGFHHSQVADGVIPPIEQTVVA